MKWISLSKVVIGLIGLSLTSTARAQSDAAAPAPADKPAAVTAAPVAAPVEAPKKKAEKPKTWKVNGLFDLYYAANFNNPADNASLPTGTNYPGMQTGKNQYRFYDGYARQMSLNLIEVSLLHKTPEVSFLIDLDFGQMAELNAISPSGAYDESSKHIGQAFITYTPASMSNWTFDIGKFYTFVGLEVAKAKDNWNYSRSLLYSYAIPVWHAGAHVNYAAGSMVNVGAYVLNGWNTLYSLNSANTFGFQLKITPNENLAIIYNGITGPQNQANASDQKVVHEANVSYTITPKIALGIDFADGSEQNKIGAGQDTKWTAYSAALKYQIDDNNYISPRVESFKDTNGSVLNTSIIQAHTMQSITLTYGYKCKSGMEGRIEYRQDSSDKDNAFQKGDGSNTKTQQTALIAFLYSI